MIDANANMYNINSLDANPDFDFVKLCSDNIHDENFFSVQGDSPYDINNFNCSYSSPTDYISDASNSNLVFMSINLQSINAKFSDLNELITILSLKKSEPDVICVQELWQFPADADFSLPGYHNLLYKLRRNNVQGGVLVSTLNLISIIMLMSNLLYSWIVFLNPFLLIFPLKTKKLLLVQFIDRL